MRHYCDHCKKSTGTKPAMVKHEKACTANPDRVCSMRDRLGEAQLTMTELQEAFFSKGFKALQEAAHHCPACILAAQRQFYKSHPDITWITDDRDQGYWTFKEACKEFWKSYNEDHREYPEY
jgi:hypothetical protein